jgi:uncharacterized protein (DUF433 family)
MLRACLTLCLLYFWSVNERIQIDPQVCHGKPVIRGTRVLVSTILGALGAGDSMADVLADYPGVTQKDIEAALEFASRLSDYQESAYGAVA